MLLTEIKYGVRSPKFTCASCVQLYSLPEIPQPPAFGLIYEGAILVGPPTQTTSLCDPLDLLIENT